MRLQTSLLPAMAAIAIILGSGYVHGVYSFRWSAAKEMQAAVAKLDHVPKRFGDWAGVDVPLDERQAKMAQFAGAVSRRYVNAKTGDTVTIMLVCGRPGPISSHTPDLCYQGGGYQLVGERAKISVDHGTGDPAEFWEIRVDKPGNAQSQSLMIDYSWYADGAWTAPKVDGRLQFAGYSVLFKLYAIREVGPTDDRKNPDPSVAFLRDFLSELDKAFGGEA